MNSRRKCRLPRQSQSVLRTLAAGGVAAVGADAVVVVASRQSLKPLLPLPLKDRSQPGQ
jgi:hypothetical protein